MPILLLKERLQRWLSLYHSLISYSLKMAHTVVACILFLDLDKHAPFKKLWIKYRSNLFNWYNAEYLEVCSCWYFVGGRRQQWSQWSSMIVCEVKTPESLVNNQLKVFLSRYFVLIPQQSAFRPQRSTTSALTLLVCDIWYGFLHGEKEARRCCFCWSFAAYSDTVLYWVWFNCLQIGFRIPLWKIVMCQSRK